MKIAAPLLAAVILVAPALSAPGWAKSNAPPQPAKGTYSFQAYLADISGTCGSAEVGEYNYGSFVYPGPGKAGTVVTFTGINASVFKETVLTIPTKTPAKSDTSWTGSFSATGYPFNNNSGTDEGTFTGTISFVSTSAFMIQLVLDDTTSGCTKTENIAAWLD